MNEQINPARPARSLTVRELLEAAHAAEKAATATSAEEEMAAAEGVFAHMETIQLAMIDREMRGISESRHNMELLPLQDEGDDIGRVEARIPKALFFHLMQQRNFGPEGFGTDDGMKDFLKGYPQCRVKTVSGKTVVAVNGLAK